MKEMLPGGVPSLLRSSSRSYIDHGDGAICWDNNNKRYVDWVCGYGTLILGHANHEVNQRIVKQLNKGMMFVSGHILRDELSMVIREIYNVSENSLILKTGSEAVSAAIRLARGFTNKPRIIRCGFHGWHDSVVSPAISWHSYEHDAKPYRLIPGVLQNSSEHLAVTWDGISFDSLVKIFEAYRNQIAALIIDPVQISEPIEENIKQLIRLAHEEEALFILDEAKTCFRVSLGGVQKFYQIEPDLSILSKGISNGLPLSMVVGRKEILELAKEVKIMGTYNNELLSVAAALETVKILKQPESISRLWKVGQALIDGINVIVSKWGIESVVKAVPYQWPCMPFIWFRSSSERVSSIKRTFYASLEQNGVLMLPDHMNFACLAHTEQDIKDTLEAIDLSLAECLSLT